MYSLFRLSKVCLIIIGLALILLAAGCDPYQEITFDNHTPFPIQVNAMRVSLDHSGTFSFTWDNEYSVIQPGESEISPCWGLWPDRKIGTMYKYKVVAIIQTNEVVFSRVFTWDELHDSGWRVEIVMQKQE